MQVRCPETMLALQGQFDPLAYGDLLMSRPWDAMYQAWRKYFEIFRAEDFSLRMQRRFRAILCFIRAYAQEIWERLHWVYIPEDHEVYSEQPMLAGMHDSRHEKIPGQSVLDDSRNILTPLPDFLNDSHFSLHSILSRSAPTCCHVLSLLAHVDTFSHKSARSGVPFSLLC